MVTARWSSGNKDTIGTAIAEASRVWFSTANGLLTEVFYPTPDQACLRLMEIVVTDGGEFCSEAGRDARHSSLGADELAPISTVRSECTRGRYVLEHETIADPVSDVVLQRVRLRAVQPGTLRVFCILEPHLGNRGDDNTATVSSHKGTPMLCASRADGLALALACSAPLLAATAGYLGDDGRTQLHARGELYGFTHEAGPGNVSLVAEIDLGACGGCFELALAFARTTSSAAHAAHAALYRGYDTSRAHFLEEWQRWHAQLAYQLPRPPRLWARSATVLKTLEAKHPDAGRVAALSTPWGESRGPGVDGTYHLIWTRDLVESVGALLAMGAHHEARRALHYLRATQEADGHWPQNMTLDGEPVWNNDELDEVALPLVFLHLILRANLLTDAELNGFWPMLRKAAGYIALHGPTTTRDRWEDASGITPFTIATVIVALLIVAELAEQRGELLAATVLHGLADQWNASIETWLYRTGGALAEQVGVAGYYVRVREPGTPHPELDLAKLPKTELSPDALALVRFGLRAADDPRILDTVRVIDARLRVELPGGSSWRRYPGDEYGEHADGAAFSYDADSIGRPWPLLTGERAHYELARGNIEGARQLLHAMESFANATGNIPEQVWDEADLPARRLIRGQPTGSAAPLGWAHGEYAKLARSLAEGRVFDLPRHAAARYANGPSSPPITTWRAGEPVVPTVGALRVVCRAPATITWRAQADGPTATIATRDTGLGLHVVDLAGPALWVAIDGAEYHFTARPT